MKKEEAGMYSGVENEGSSEKLSEQYPGIITLRELPEDKQKIVRKDLRMFGEDIYRLHLELVTDWEPEAVWGRYEESAEYYRDVLKKYGEVRYGDTITRDILVPGGLPLYALHYVIQRLFGWENSHLHRFELPEERVLKLSDGKREKLAELIGLVFRSPWMEEEEEFWADDYEGGSFLAWLRKKYTGPCLSLCHGESYFQCRKDVEQYLAGSYTDKKRGWREMVADMKVLERLPVEVVLCFGDRRCPGQGYEKLAEGDRILAVEDENPTDGDGKLAEGDELPECFADFMDEEMLDEIRDVKNGPDEPNNQPIIGCVTKELLYFYDFGDGWNVRITGSLGCEDLVDAGRVTQEELDDAMVQLYTTYRPVVIAQDGLRLVDDVGGPGGFCHFLLGTYGDGDPTGMYEDREENLEWAKGLGWSRRKYANRKFL